MRVNPPARQSILPTPSTCGSGTALPLQDPRSNHPSFPAKHSRAEESRCRSTPSLPRPSRCPRGCGDPSPCPSASAPLVGAVREPPVPLPFPSLTTRHSQLSTAEPRNLVVVAPPPSRAPPVVLADAGTHPPARQPLWYGRFANRPFPSPL